MAEGAEYGSVTAGKRRPAAGRKSRQSRQKSCCSRVSLEKVLGISTASSSGLTSDPTSGLIAYTAGCVIVLLHPKKNKQSHILNTSRKPFSAVAFSHDGKHLVTGESGHMPCVRVWEVGGAPVAEVQCHKYGVSCVAFSTNSCYIVSVGYQHDMTVSVWDWRKGSIIASNKVSSRVSAVSFSQDNSYFVTAGTRHVKFWYLDASKERRVNSTVPLIGRSGLLGDHKNCVFSGVACGRGLMASSTYCITSSGLLCLFNSSRQLEAWVNLKTESASCLSVSEDHVFCGCADGVIRVFDLLHLQYVTKLQRPHRLGVDISRQHSSLFPVGPDDHFPDTLALTFDPAAKHLTCVYDDHSVYVWDVKDVRSVGKLYSALYHSSCVWSVEVYPQLSDVSQACLPPSSFLTCSSDNTIRVWHADPPTAATAHKNLYSNDLSRIVYVGENTQHLQAEGKKAEAAGADGKSGIRVLGISPDGRHLAAGDRCGNLRIFALEFLDELVKIEAHDSEVLCLEFSPTSTGLKLLASASRDRLIHIFNLEKNFNLEQTLNDHSASITAVKFTGESPEVQIVSCGADKSIYFQTAEQTAEGLSFSRSHHVVEKTTLYDMDLDSSKKHVVIACQDRNVRVYDVETGKLKRCLKGSSSDEGSLLKVQMDPSGSFFATSCSDKNITIFDYESGECVATLFGHAEIVTCMRFSHDCRHLITVSGDSCVFVWRLDAQMTSTMRKRRGLRLKVAPDARHHKPLNIRRETFITVPSSQQRQAEEEEDEEEEESDLRTPTRLDFAQDVPQLQTNGKLPLWFRKVQGQGGASTADQPDAGPRQCRSRWTEQLNPLTICSNCSPSPPKSPGEEDEEVEEDEDEEEDEDFHPQSLESLLGENQEEGDGKEEEDEDFHPQSVERLMKDGEKEVLQPAGENRSSYVLHPSSSAPNRKFDVEDVPDPQRSLTQLEVRGQGAEPVWCTQLSPDSACFEGSAGSSEQPLDADTDSLSQGSSVGSLGPEDDEDRNLLKNHFDTLASSLSEEKFDTDLRTLQPPEEKHFLNPRLSISARFLSRFQDRLRVWPSRAPPPVSIPTRISEESVINTSENVESSSNAGSNESTLRESCSDVTSTNSMVSAVQQRVSRLGYLGTTASSRSKVSQDPPTSNSPSAQEEEKENLWSSSDSHPGPDPPEDQTSSVALSSQKPRLHLPAETSPQVWTTPTEGPSEGGASRWSASSIDKTPTNQNQMIIPSPAPCITSTCSLSGERAGPESDETLGDDSSCGPPSSASCPLSDRPCPPLSGAVEAVTLQQCQQVANELRHTTRRAVRLHQQLGESLGFVEQQLQMSSVLQEAFESVHSELQVVLQGEGQGSSTPSGGLEGAGTLSLLEKYSELLLQMTQNKLNRI
ncbi:WD repeat-containing protein 62 isoform X1 [Pleuronectes platessa]|uniref:WD repeat-containing protein 62 isoform X1 n=1 Tax=Pleuronectes platessa TaxID=8262 RepID=UPI00232A3455|nr:WD repeat-containing protein 62 isoform X1 [Pleuronectes platessa]